MSVQIAGNQIKNLAIDESKIANATISGSKLNISGQTFDFSGGTLRVATTPSNDNDAVSKAYLDGLVGSGVFWKEPARVASTGAVTIANPATSAFDGVTLSSGDRVLLKDQSAASENGIYIFNGSSSAMTRAPLADTAAELNGAALFITEGSTNADEAYVQTATISSLGSDSVTFVRFSGLGQVTAGLGLTKTGDTLNVSVDDSSIEITGDSLNIKASGITDGMLAGSISAAKLAGSIGDSKLSTITTANKVSGSAIQLNGSGGLENSSGLKISDLAVTDGMLAGSISAAKLAGSIGDSKLSTITTANKVSGSAVQLAGSGGLEDSSGLKISVGGVSSNMLAGSIADSKLNTISTANKVSGSAIQLAGSSGLEDSSGLKISVGGVSSDMLAGSIADSKLSTITTANKVSGSAVQLAGSGGLEDSSGLQIEAGGVTNAMLSGNVEAGKLAFAPMVDKFTPNGSQNAFTLSTPVPENWEVILVFRNGVFVEQKSSSPSGVDEFTVGQSGSDTVVTFGSNLANNDIVLVYYFTNG